MKKSAIASAVAFALLSVSAFGASTKIINGVPITNPPNKAIFADDIILSLSNNVVGEYDIDDVPRNGVIAGTCHIAGSKKNSKNKCSVVGIQTATGSRTDVKALYNGADCKGGGSTGTTEDYEIKGPRVFASATNGGSVSGSGIDRHSKEDCDNSAVSATISAIWQ